MQIIEFVCKCSNYYEPYFLLSRLTQRKAATRMWKESSSRLAPHQPEGCCATGNKARAEARERAGHRHWSQCSRSIIWNLTAAKLALRVAKLVGCFWRRWQKVAKGTSHGSSPNTGLKAKPLLWLYWCFWKKTVSRILVQTFPVVASAHPEGSEIKSKNKMEASPCFS